MHLPLSHFAILVVLSASVRVCAPEKYIAPFRGDKDARSIELTSDRWLLELDVYRMAASSQHEKAFYDAFGIRAGDRM